DLVFVAAGDDAIVFGGIVTATDVFPRAPLCLLFLQIAAVRQKNGAQVAGGLGGVNLALEAVLYRFRNSSDVIEVRMAEDAEVDSGRAHPGRQPVLVVAARCLLIESEVAEETDGLISLADLEEVQRTGDGSSRSQEVQTQASVVSAGATLTRVFGHSC